MKDKWQIEPVVLKRDARVLKQIGMSCYDKEIAKESHGLLVRLLFCRYFSKRKFRSRLKRDVYIAIARKDGVVGGFYELEPNGLLSSLYVLPTLQHQGMGKTLLDDALAQAKKRELAEIHLDASLYAVAFYERYGFKKVGKKRELLEVEMLPMTMKVYKG